MKSSSPIIAVTLLLSLIATTLIAETPDIRFNRDVRPVLSEHCFACHGFDEKKREADLRLDQAGHEAIVPGRPNESEMWRRINSSDPDEVMPPPDTDKKISAEQQAMLRRWIQQGAKYEQHWSFIAPAKPAVPKITNVDNPIDAFIQKRLAAEQLTPAPKADKETLLRRVTLDLTGLPPTTAELDAFLADNSDDAYGKVVERLQSQMTYGEHMARYWLDLARYADTHGLHLDNERSMWPYRDWVVRAISENLPFDEFTRWQLAGDQLPNPTRDQLIASGFNRCNVTTGEGGSIQAEWVFRYAVERTSTTAEVWMGLTAGCAVCHDHKFDPLSTKEFYSLYAFFHSAADPAMDGNKIDTPPILKLPKPEDEKKLADLTQQLDTTAAKIKERLSNYEYTEPTDEAVAQDPANSWSAWKSQEPANRNKSLSGELKNFVRDRSPEDWNDEETDRVFKHWLRNTCVSSKESIKPLEETKQSLTKQKADIEKAIPLTFVMADLKKPRASFVMQRGAYDKPGEKVSRSVPGFLPPLTAKNSTVDSPPADGPPVNRLDLANWLLSPEHPLTARVTVNRIWQQFFGTGLVETAEDFGTQGQLPSHPDLLDWLAVQFMADGWDMKQLVRRIVTSRAYQQSSKALPSLIARDPNNRLLARGPRLRLDAEVLRDQALFVSGLLVPTIGGQGVKPYQPPNIWEPVGFGSSNTRYYKQGTGDELYRRSIYTFLKRTAPPPFMSTFDAPNREQACSRRGRSNTPMQALQLMNDIQHVEAARNFAWRIMSEGGDNIESRVRWAWRTVTSRLPDATEVAIAQDVLRTHRSRYDSDSDAAEKLIAYGQSKADPDLNPSELAAYTMLANLILNLDESVNKN